MTSPEAYSPLFEQLERDNVRYVVVSGMAVFLHGHNRPVVDLDIAIDSSPNESAKAMQTLPALQGVGQPASAKIRNSLTSD